MQAVTQAVHLQAILPMAGQPVRIVIDTQHGFLLIHRVGQGVGLQAVI